MSLINDGQSSSGTGGQGGGTSDGTGGAGNQNAGTQVFDFKPLLPEPLRAEKTFESFKPKDQNEFIQELAKGYHNAQGLIGKKGLIVPDDKSTPEARAEFYKALGRPDRFEDYGTPLPQGADASRVDAAKLGEWKKELFEAGIPKAAADKLIGRYLSEAHARDTEMANTITGWETKTRQEFGQDFDRQINFAKYAIKEFGSEDLVAALDQTGFGSHPEMLKMLAKMGAKMGDHQAAGGQGAQTTNFATLTPEAAQMEIQAFERNAEKMKAVREKNHPDHDRYVKEHTELYLKAFPPGSKS